MKLLSALFLKLLLVALVIAQALNKELGAIESAAQRVDVFTKYFRFHGVRSLIVIVCPNDIAASDGRNHLHHFINNFLRKGFYVRIFKDDSYLNVDEPITDTSNTSRPLKNFDLQSLSHKSGVLLFELNSACALRVLRWSAASKKNFFTSNRFWLLLTNKWQSLDLLQDSQFYLPTDGEVRVLVRYANLSEFDLIDIYKVAHWKPLKRHTIGEKLQNAEQMLVALESFGSAISYRQDLERITFNTGLVIAFPDLFTNIEDLSMRHIDTISKVNNRLTIELANKLNMRFNTLQTDNYGWRNPNGSFDGLMGRFQRYELDFAQNGIFMRLDRIALCDFVAETFRIRAGIMFRQPPLSAVANIFSMPFENDVWCAILLLMIFTVAVFALELMFSPHLHDMDFWDCVIFVWGAMCQQGFYVTMGNYSARVLVFTTFVATLFLFTSFSANIVALLQTPSEAIHSLSDLSESPLEIGVQDTVYNKIFFNESTDPVTNRLYHKKIASKGDSIYMRPLVGMEKMRTGLFAYQVELQAGYQIISDTFSEPEKCGLKELEPFQLPMLAIPTRKNFPYKELFRRQLRWQREVGLMNREERRWFPQKPKCETGMGGFVSIGLTECRYALAMFGFGMLAGVLIFFLEHLSKRFLKSPFWMRNLIRENSSRQLNSSG